MSVTIKTETIVRAPTFWLASVLTYPPINAHVFFESEIGGGQLAAAWDGHDGSRRRVWR